MSTYQQAMVRGKAPSAKQTVSVADAPEDGNIRAIKTGRKPEPGTARPVKKKLHKANSEAKSRTSRKMDGKSITHKAAALPAQAPSTPQELALRAKLREVETEARKLRQAMTALDLRAIELEQLSEEAVLAKQNVERDLKLLRDDRARLATHYDRLVDSKSWRAMAAFRLLRNLAGDAHAALHTAPLHFQVRLKANDVVSVSAKGSTFTLTPTSRRMPRGWVRLRTESEHRIFSGPVRLYFDIGGGFNDFNSLEIPVDDHGDFDVMCKLPRHISALMLRATPSDMPYGEIVAYPTVGLVGFGTIFRHEFALTRSP